jgi:hypothetical protein
MLAKTDSGAKKQTIPPKRWTFVEFGPQSRTKFVARKAGTIFFNVILRIEYPRLGCPKTLRGRFVRWPETDQADETGHNDVNPIPGYVRHHHWDHFMINQSNMPVGFMIWHDGSQPVVLDGRQIKSVVISSGA